MCYMCYILIMANENRENKGMKKVEIIKNDNRKKFQYEVSCNGVLCGSFASHESAKNHRKIVERNVRTDWGRLG